ncbi:hypothetical protein IPM19_04710 [bacterium]|nr:MAG: hypothetical protein IPM19_04710 [bacterium]
MSTNHFEKIVWSPDFAYVIGLIVTDGNLSKDGRHINFTSKDIELVNIVKNTLNLTNKISLKIRGAEPKTTCYFLQFGSINLYKFLLSIGLMPSKSKVIAEVKIPKRYYDDFLRGHFDGDGTFYSYKDKRWPSSFLFYLVFMSASENHINWLRVQNSLKYRVSGHISKNKNSSVYQLRYGKKESLVILRKMYSNSSLCLTRKLLKIKQALDIISESL